MSEPDDTSVRNTMSGSVTGNTVQIGAVHGNVIWRSRGAVILVVATLIAALGAGVGFAWVTLSSATTQEAPVSLDSEPLTVTVELLSDMCLVPWVVHEPSAEIDLSVPMTNHTWRAWEPTRNGISAAPANVRLTVQGRSDVQVVLTGIQVQVHERRHPPLAGTAINAVCGDRGALRWLRVDLDAEPPRIMPVVSDYATQLPDVPHWERQPIRFPYEVSLSDAETFLIEANTLDCTCAWTAELSWASQGRTGTVQINDNGEWFRTSSTRDMTWCSVYTMPGLAPNCRTP